MNFEINLIFLVNLFFNMTKKSSQKFKYLENEKSFQSKLNHFTFHHFIKKPSVAKNCLRLESAPLNLASFKTQINLPNLKKNIILYIIN